MLEMDHHILSLEESLMILTAIAAKPEGRECLAFILLYVFLVSAEDLAVPGHGKKPFRTQITVHATTSIALPLRREIINKLPISTRDYCQGT